MPRTHLLQRHSWIAPLLAGVVHAALMVLAAQPVNLCLLSPLAVLPLAWFLKRGTTRPWRDAGLLMVGVAPAWLLWEWWMIEVTAPGFPFFIVLQASWTALFFGVVRGVQRGWPRVPMVVLGPAAWVAVEFFRGEYFLSGYASGLLAYPMIVLPRLAAPAAWLGVYFVSFLLACIGFGVADLLWTPRRWTVGGGVIGAALLAWSAAVLFVPRGPGSREARVVRPGILQTNVPQSNKIGWTVEEEVADWQRFAMWTRMLAEQERPPQFLMWPETMMPGDTLEPAVMALYDREKLAAPMENSKYLPSDAFYKALLALQQEAGLPMLVGEEALVNVRLEKDGERVRKKFDARYNSAYLVTDGKVQPTRYDKVCLTPFGETMPLISRWPWLQNQLLAFGANGMSFDLAAGTEATVFRVPLADGDNSGARDMRVVTPICFETTVSHHCRRLVFDHGVRQADLIASLTNDGWFGDSDIARLQHLQVARWRCVELATPMARSANTGISALIDCDGRLVARGVQGTETASHLDGVLTGSLALCGRVTLFARVGNVFPGTVTGVVMAALVPAFFRRRGPKGAEKESAAAGLKKGTAP